MTWTVSWGVWDGWLHPSYFKDQIKGLQGTSFSWVTVAEGEQISPPVPSQGAGSSICQL